MAETTYRETSTALELEELRRHSNELEKEVARYRKVFNLWDKLVRSWYRSDLVPAFLLLVFIGLFTGLLFAGVRKDFSMNMSRAHAIETGVALLQTNRVNMTCGSSSIKEVFCVVFPARAVQSIPSPAVALRCDENGCVIDH